VHNAQSQLINLTNLLKEMFGNKKNVADTTTYSSGHVSTINTLVEGTHLEGTINTQSDLRVDGQVNGTIHCDGKLIIGAPGVVEGDVVANNAVIEGRFDGNLHVHEVLDVRETAEVTGEIKTGKLLVQNGATFTGNCDMGHKIKNLTAEAV